MKRSGGCLEAVVILSAVDWGGLWQRPHHLARAWAAQGLRVLFVENMGARSLRASDVCRVAARLRSGLRSARSPSVDLAGPVEIWSPLLPPGVSGVVTAVNAPLAMRALRRHLRAWNLPPQATGLVTYPPTRLALQVVQGLPWGRTIYDVVADVRALHPHLAASEDLLLASVDQVTTASHTLAERYAARANRPVRHIPDGFVAPPPTASKVPLPRDRPLAVYLGGLNARVDLKCLRALAEERPQWDLLLFAKVSVRVPSWFSRANIQVRPPVARHDDLWPVLRGCSVGLVPYTRDAYADGMHPAKLQEYLLAGLPVVATATTEMRWLREHGVPETIFLAEGPGDFPRAVDEALREETAERRRVREVWARTRPWDRVAREFVDLMEVSVA